MENFSRRDFFNKFIPKAEPKDGPVSETNQESRSGEPTEMSRKTFLKFITAFGAAAALGQLGQSAKAEEKQVVQDSKDSLESEEETSPDIESKEEDSYSETAIEQSLMICAKYIASKIFQELKIEHGNKSLSDEELLKAFRDRPFSSFMENVVIGPATEEFIFRALPSGLIDKKDKSQRWDIGIPATVLFAALHNVSEKEKGEYTFAKSIPITQFMGGLFYWYLMREKGYGHATFAHAINNSIPMAIGIYLFKAYPEKEATEKTKKFFGMKENTDTANEE